MLCFEASCLKERWDAGSCEARGRVWSLVDQDLFLLGVGRRFAGRLVLGGEFVHLDQLQPAERGEVVRFFDSLEEDLDGRVDVHHHEIVLGGRGGVFVHVGDGVTTCDDLHLLALAFRDLDPPIPLGLGRVVGVDANHALALRAQPLCIARRVGGDEAEAVASVLGRGEDALDDEVGMLEAGERLALILAQVHGLDVGKTVGLVTEHDRSDFGARLRLDDHAVVAVVVGGGEDGTRIHGDSFSSLSVWRNMGDTPFGKTYFRLLEFLLADLHLLNCPSNVGIRQSRQNETF
jgi:hypothetical protein